MYVIYYSQEVHSKNNKGVVNMKMRTSQEKTLIVCEGKFTQQGKINVNYLCSCIVNEIFNNNEFLYLQLCNKRKKITSLIWEAFTSVVNKELLEEYGNYYASSYQLKKFINNDYSVFDQANKRLTEERKEILG